MKVSFIILNSLAFDIYFIAKGDTFVSIRDTHKKEFKNFKKLLPGEHFGEISLLYKCPRTATIMAGNYCTYAILPPENFKKLISEVPEIEEKFKKYTYSYEDEVKKWMLKVF